MTKNIIKPVLLALYLLFAFHPAARAEGFEVEISGNKLALHAQKIPLRNILRQIAVLGISVRIDPDINPEISASFTGWDLEAGLKSILKSTDHILIWETTKGAPDSRPVLIEIQVFKPGEKERMKLIEARSVFAVARRGEKGPFFIKGEILVRIGKGADLDELTAAVERTGGEIFAVSDYPGVYRIRFPDDYDVFSLADQLKKFPGIETAEPNYAYPVTHPERVGRVRRTTLGLPDIPEDGTGMPVAVLDSGIQMNTNLQDRVKAVLNAFDSDAIASDTLGHGTQMALIAAGLVTPAGKDTVAPGSAEVLPIKIFDDNGFTTSLTVLRSVTFAIKNGARVLSLSWGSETGSEIMESIFKAASEKGLMIVAAAGNEPTGNPVYPAAYDSVIGVGALNPDGGQWENSNYGEFVSFYAPGFATLPVGYKGDPGTYAGTSIATAYTANVISSYLSQNPEAELDDTLKYLREVFKSQ
jgi:thermitase